MIVPAMLCLIRIASIGSVAEKCNPGTKNGREPMCGIKTLEAGNFNLSRRRFRLNEYFGKKNLCWEFYTESVPDFAYLLR
jgi:hypothetical protein